MGAEAALSCNPGWKAESTGSAPQASVSVSQMLRLAATSDLLFSL